MTTVLPPIGLGLMCKPPRPGASKTRLAATIGAEAAALLSRAFLEDCSATVLTTAEACVLQPAVYYRPADAAAELAAILGPSWTLAFADAGELGATMRDVLGRLLAASPAGAMVMGADVPAMGGEIIARAAGVLREGHARSVVIVPSADGGYCLIGIRSVAAGAPLFAPMVWSTSEVLAETLARAESHGLDVTLLPVQRDIDDVSDLDWLRLELAGRPDLAPHSRSALASIGPRADHG